MRDYPAAYQGVIAVGASDANDRRAAFSNYGGHLSVVAPGEWIYSTFPQAEREPAAGGGAYAVSSGTSMAAPHVTGLIGYMLTFDPSLKPAQIKACIEQNADYVDGRQGFSEECGWGRINVLKTVKAVADGNVPGAYPLAPVKVTMPKNLNNLRVYLYACSPDGAVENYVASSISGPSYAGYAGEGKAAAEDGVVWFNMLRPGHYVAKSMVGGRVGATDVFRVEPGQAGPLELDLEFPFGLLVIQTFPTWNLIPGIGGGLGAQPTLEVSLYDSPGQPDADALRFEGDAFGVFALPALEPGDHWIRVSDWAAAPGRELYHEGGEYCLYVTDGAPYIGGYYVNDGAWPLPPGDPDAGAVGTFSNPIGGERGAQATSMAAAPAIDLDTIYYACFRGPLYGGPDATSGAAGHYYRLSAAGQ
jgi:hypothetical protein